MSIGAAGSINDIHDSRDDLVLVPDDCEIKADNSAKYKRTKKSDRTDL
jgi:hypothetical protein